MGTGTAMKRTFFAILILSLFVFSPGCDRQPKPVQTQEFALGTIVNQLVYGKNAHKAAKEVSVMIKERDGLWTINQPGGDINNLNRHAGQEAVQLKPETIDLLIKAGRISDLSRGAAFDITVAPLVKAWGIGTEHARVPSDEEIKALLPLVNYLDVQVDEASNTASLRKPGQMADLGGIAKGYIGDLAMRIYKKNGITSAFVNLGGNVVVLGRRPDGTPWKVGIQDPRGQNGEIVGFVDAVDQAVVTSGDYQRYFIQDGKRYCHILDPHTGTPADSGLMSVTIVAASSTDADGLAKAYVIGLKQGLELVKRYGKAEAIFIANDKKIYVTPGLKGKFHLEDGANGYQYIQIR